MIFSSIFFLCIFLPVTLILYYIVPWKLKNFVLLLCSLIFYAWGEPIYVLLMIFSIVFNYLAGLQMEGMGQLGLKKRRKGVFVFTVVVDIAILCFFKYYGFALTNINGLLHTSIPIKNLALPIGISFYTFQILSYVIDVYWENVPAQHNIIDFGAYISMFPQLIAGPIVRYEDIQKQLKRRKLSLQKFSDGAAWFIRGLAKKVLLANNIGMLFDDVFAIEAASRPALTTILGVIAYTFQIYFDFSGYSDMAIGLGKMMGFEFVRNFEHPYISTSITEFWRRWHISLGTWFREYVYIPMGGNRVSIPKHIRNILVVWILTGFWHGAAWNFVLWGLYYGVLLLIEKYILGRVLNKIPRVIRHIYTIILFVYGWLIFSSETLKDIGQNTASIFGKFGQGFANANTGYLLTTNLVLLILCVFCSLPIAGKLLDRLQGSGNRIAHVAAVVIYVLIFAASFAYLVNATYNPFLYFKF